jgi:hypothetical protein
MSLAEPNIKEWRTSPGIHARLSCQGQGIVVFLWSISMGLAGAPSLTTGKAWGTYQEHKTCGIAASIRACRQKSSQGGCEHTPSA